MDETSVGGVWGRLTAAAAADLSGNGKWFSLLRDDAPLARRQTTRFSVHRFFVFFFKDDDDVDDGGRPFGSFSLGDADEGAVVRFQSLAAHATDSWHYQIRRSLESGMLNDSFCALLTARQTEGEERANETRKKKAPA